ncbi:MAG TPA: TetR/AcrR family transcriptional regulator [Candidatus Eisenbacteria bacterium]|nr:TetR/AcrR family transcriptional regulator [Candidatus Eisenbacteria bacterium]
MGIQERRQREKEELRDLILDTARELFVERGYEAVTMRGVAERIEYSPTAIYLHFADKESLIRAICDADFGALAGRFQSIAKIENPVERIAAIGRAYASFAQQYPNHYRLMFMTPLPGESADRSSLERGNPEQDAYAFLRQAVDEALRAEKFRKEFKDPDLLSQILWSGIHGVVSLRIAKCTDDWVPWVDENATLETMIDSLLRGLLREED